MAAESGAFIHAEAVQRKSRVYRPGLTNAQTSSRVSPLAMHVRHRRQRPRPDGATHMWYVLCFCLKLLLLMRAGRGGGGARAGTGAFLFALAPHWKFANVWQKDQHEFPT